MDHPDEKIIHAYVDHMLDAKEEEALSTHLLTCLQCRHEVDELTSLCHTLGELPAPPPHRRLTHRILKAARGETWNTRLSPDRIASLFGPMGWSAMAMGLIAGTLLGLSVGISGINATLPSATDGTLVDTLDIYEGYLISDNGELL